MKRILSLLLVLSFALAAIPMVANAEGEIYDISYDSEEGVLIINNLEADNAGRIVLGLKKSDVTVFANTGKASKPKLEEATQENQDKIWWDTGYSVASSYMTEDDNYIYLAVNWYDMGDVNTSTDPDDYLFWVNVEFVDEEALNSESIITDLSADVLNKLLPEAAGRYGCTLINKYGETSKPVKLKYPGSDITVGGNDPVESWTVADSSASATVVYNSPVSGTPMIAVYDATGKMIGFKAETTAVENQSSFTISTTYDGTAAKAKVFVWAANKTTTVSAKVWTPAN